RIDFAEKLDDAMKRYEEAFAAPILYTTKFAMSAEVTEHYPKTLPPLRSDTPTLIIGRVKTDAKSVSYSIEGTRAAGRQEVAVALPDLREEIAAPELDNYFLLSIMRQWKNAPTQPALIRADRA